MGKVAHLCRVKPIRIAVATVLGELRCGHITNVYFGMGWCELFWGMCPAVVPCATADDESGSSLKIGSCVGQHYVLFGTKKTCFENPFLSNEPLHKLLFSRKLNPSIILDLPCALYSVYTPSVGVVGLAEYVVLTPFLIFIEEDTYFVPEDVE